ncbi:MAG: gliding motility-associated ABC transporter substrate-binding protein GldG [Chitinophagales bacterium]
MVNDKHEKQGKGKRLNRRDALMRLGLLLAIIILANVVSNFLYFRLDMTAEKRYSISKPSKELLRNLKDEVTIKVYLTGELNAQLERLRKSTENMLKEFRSYGGTKVEYEFFDPMSIKDLNERKKFMMDLIQRGMSPTNSVSQTKTSKSESLVFPYAMVAYGGKEYPVNLLENQIGYDATEIINHSEILLEYKLINAIKKLSQYRPPRIGFVEGNGELTELETADLKQTLEELQYEVKRIDLRTNVNIPERFDAVIVARPTIPFSEQDKFKLDQYVMRGGKVMWLMDGTNVRMDSVSMSPNGQNVEATDYNLDDQLFKYGARINGDIVQDIGLCDEIQLVVGKVGDAPQTQAFKWYYYPLLVSDNNHAVVRNLAPVVSHFASTVDTIRNPGVKKTILLHTTDYSKTQLSPTRVGFSILMGKPNPDYYKQPQLPVAVLLEGEFESVFKNRLSPEFLSAIDTIDKIKFVEKSPASKMIVIGDGDMIRNDTRSDSSVYQLGFNKYNGRLYANKEFLMNCLEYLIDDSGIFETRNKEVKVRLLDSVKANNERLKWQLLNLVLPVVIILLFAVGFNFLRRRKYAA